MSSNVVVADIMTREIAVLHEEDNLEQISERMDSLGLHHLPVVDGTRLVGLISHYDILRFAVSELLLFAPVARSRERYLEENTFVGKVMRRNPATVSPQTPIAEAAELLHIAKVGCLPVVIGDQLVGIVTETDFLGLLVKLLKTDSGAPAL